MRGTFIFPKNDRDFLQQLEMRGNNGCIDDLETMYVLTGSTYYVPERLFNCDDPSLYRKVEPRLFNGKLRKVAQRIDEAYEGRSGPKLLAFFHTHPNGRAYPSDGDKQAIASWKQRFDRYFDDYQFFAGLHGLHDDDRTPDPSWMRVPEQTDHHEVSWYGEYRRHTLSVYDEDFDPRPVMVTTAAEMQQHLQQPGGGWPPGPDPGPGSGPEPGGEIWD